MKTFKMILKGILLYTTMLSLLLTLGALESIIINHYIVRTTVLNCCLLIACYKTISFKEFYILTGNTLFKS